MDWRYPCGVIRRFICPWLGAEVELTEERERHIVGKHRELLPAHREKIAEVLWYTDLGRGRHVVVVVVSHTGRAARHWIVTGYMARRLPVGGIEWRRG